MPQRLANSNALRTSPQSIARFPKTRLRRDSFSDDAIAEKEFANEQDSRKLILDEIRDREWITTADAVRILGIQKRQVQRMLKDLIDEGFVARLGSGPSTRYVALSKKEETHE